MKIEKRGGKSVRQKVTTTLARDLWQELQIEALRQRRDANDILEELIKEYLSKTKQKGGKR
jgi:hypothetical protein